MKPKVFVAVPSYGGVPVDFLQGLMHLQAEPPCDLEIKLWPGDSLVSRARNSLSAEFLAGDCTHLLFIDSDLIFSPDQIRMLLDVGEPLVGGFYPKKKEGSVEWVCNSHLQPLPVDDRGLQPLRYIGTGFMLIAREVFERMLEQYGSHISYRPDNGPHQMEHDFWSVGPYTYPDGLTRYLSEDWYFCQRWLDIGGKVYGHTRVILKHVGHAIYPLQSQLAALVNPEFKSAAETASKAA